MSAYFVTGAGTEIGKTYISAALLRSAHAIGLKVGAVKPLMSGFDPNDLSQSDAGQLLAAYGRAPTAKNIHAICRHSFEAPLAPNVAARQAGVKIDEEDLCQFIEDRIAGAKSTPADQQITLVEGAGGVMSPATDAITQIDLMVRLGLPIIFVTGVYLGAVTHCLTALEALDRRNLKVVSILVSQSDKDGKAPETLSEELSRFRNEPLINAPFGDGANEVGQALLKVLTSGGDK